MVVRRKRWGLVLALGLSLVLSACSAPAEDQETTPPISIPRLASNGEQIYFTATSQRGGTIAAQGEFGMAGGAAISCAACHGAGGQGAQGQLLTQRFAAPDIRFGRLRGNEPVTGSAPRGRNPYTEASLQRAITEGSTPDGAPLEWPMPRWDMDAEDLSDLIAWLKTLE